MTSVLSRDRTDGLSYIAGQTIKPTRGLLSRASSVSTSDAKTQAVAFRLFSIALVLADRINMVVCSAKVRVRLSALVRWLLALFMTLVLALFLRQFSFLRQIEHSNKGSS